MPPQRHIRCELPRALLVLVAIVVAGCAGSRPQPVPEPPGSPPDVVATPPPEPAVPVPAAPVAPSPRRQEVVVLFEAGTSNYAAVAAEIAGLLPADRYRVSQLAIGDEAASIEAFRTKSVAVVAVGLKAVETARAQLPGKPIVFCQVFAYEEVLAGGGRIWGVHSVPPLALQLKNWKAVDPTLQTVALILSEAPAQLAAEAVRAAATIAADVRFETSSSDRETLYLFKRLASEVDGLWLFPDNRVLSPDVLRELLSYASSHGVGVLTLNEALLQWGALLSASSTPADVAQTVRSVLGRVVAGRTQNLPAMTPLSVVELRINQGIATTLGLPIIPQSRWIARDPD